MNRRRLELLAPASNAETAIQAILHGADAVYIGPPSHGARKSAANTLEDIEKVVDFAHQYRAKVYATVNTIVYDSEIKAVEGLCKDLYGIGVDALIVQDMGILRMKLPPISLHASTQCDIRTPEKAKFLEDVGFSQLVLARELTLKEIQAITETVSIPVETFVHGALCVSYSGRCHVSLALSGRSANRGECAQICRYPFTLTDNNGKIIERNKYLLSLKDFNASASLNDLIHAGVSSFKIEGRLKETSYVKNITSLYNVQLNKIISDEPDKYSRSSFGEVTLKFSPQADKSFNRGFTDYFLNERKPEKIASLLTPKSRGELVKDLSQLNNGDGISFFDKEGKFTGVNVNKVEDNRLITARKVELPKKGQIYRTSDIKWDKLMSSETASRKIGVAVTLADNFVKASDDRGLVVSLPFDLQYEKAVKPADYRNVFEKLGNTVYYLKDFISELPSDRFYRNSELAEIRRRLIALLDEANVNSYSRDLRRPENLEVKYPLSKVDYKENIANHLAEEFYVQHGVVEYEKAAEVTKSLNTGDVLMTTRHCILRETGRCLKNKGKPEGFQLPLYLNFDGGRFRLDFDCKNCEMKVLKG